jgi:hypothetical protein
MAASIAGFPVESGSHAPTGSDKWASELVDAARRAGHTLSAGEADTGQTIWSWSRSDGTGPAFLTRRAALSWMADLLERSRTLDR